MYQQKLYPNQTPILTVNLPDGTPHVLYAAFPKQVAFHKSSVRNLLAVGSRGSGKSLMLRMDAHMRALMIPGCSLVLIRKTMKQLEESHLLNIRKEMLLLGGTYNGSTYRCDYPNGSKLFFSYVGNAGDALNLLGAEFLAAYYDELSVIPWEYFNKLNASVRVAGHLRDQGHRPVIRAATNPLGPSAAECMQYFVNKDVEWDLEGNGDDYFPEDWDYIQINMEDNPTLDVDHYKRQFAKQPEHIQAAWLRGEYMEANTMFKFIPSKTDEHGDPKPYHVLPEVDIPSLVKNARIYRAFDYGYNPDPAYCCWIAHLGHRYIVFHEKKWNGAVASEIAADIKSIDEDLGISRVVTTYCDPVMNIQTGHDKDHRTLVGIFADHGIPMEPSVNNREHFAAFLHSALVEEAEPDVPRLQIFRGYGPGSGCPYMIRAIPLQHFDEKHPLRLADQAHDHPVVSLAYFLMSHSAGEQRTFTQRFLKPWMKPKRSDKFTLGNESVRNR
jgi:hypothetical protein